MCIRETSSLKLAKLRGCTFVNQYVVIKYLGRGACGRVFLCMDMTDNRLYAVKVRHLYSGMVSTGALVADVAAGQQQAYHIRWFGVSLGLCACCCITPSPAAWQNAHLLWTTSGTLLCSCVRVSAAEVDRLAANGHSSPGAPWVSWNE